MNHEINCAFQGADLINKIRLITMYFALAPCSRTSVVQTDLIARAVGCIQFGTLFEISADDFDSTFLGYGIV